MIKLFANWMLHALSLIIVSRVYSGVRLENFESALIAVVIIAMINAFVKPVLLFLTLPITIVTLGLFSFILNALMLMLAGSITPGFEIDGFGAAIIGSILLSLVTITLQSFVK